MKAESANELTFGLILEIIEQNALNPWSEPALSKNSDRLKA